MAGRRQTEYQMAIKIAGEIEKSLPKSMRLAKSELRAIAKEAAASGKTAGRSFGQHMEEIGSSLEKVNRIGDKVFHGIVKGAKIAGAGVAAGLGASVKAGADFEAQMSTVKAISGASGSEFDALSKKALNMGSTTAFTASEAGQAMEYMAMAGWKSGDMLSGIEGIMNLAAASGEDLASTSDIVTDALTAFGLSAKDSNHFADILAQTASNANTNVAMMGETFKYVAPIAGSLGLDVEDVAQAIGVMGNAGIKSTQAGTSLRSVLIRLSTDAGASSKQLGALGVLTEKLGVQFYDKKGNVRDFGKVLVETRNAWKGLTKEEKSAYGKKIAGQNALSGFLALMESGEDDFNKLGNSIKKADGAAKKMAEIRLDNLQGDVTLFKSALEGAGVTIYQELNGPLREFVQWGTEKVGEFTKGFTEHFPEIREKILELGDSFSFLSDAAAWLIENPELISGALGAIGSTIITYKVAGGVMSAVKALKGFGALHPAVLILGGVVAALGAYAGVQKTTAEAAKRANLSEHFGDITLSMNELDTAARHIVGGKGLAQIDELFTSLSDSEQTARSLENVKHAIGQTDWKIKAGIRIKKEDREEYANQVRQYVEDTQKLIEQKGYEVSISTKLLFGNGKEGKKLLKDNNAFYAGLEKETEELSGKLNKLLKKAVEDGLDLNTQESIDKVLSQMAEINDAITQAEAASNWDILSAEWSGKNLTADTFKSLQTSINENIEKEYEGIDEATKSELTALNARYNMGDLTKAEADRLKKEAAEKGQRKKDTATEKGLKFMYDTFMSAYGKDIAEGKLDSDQSTRDAVHPLVEKMLKAKGVQGTEYEKKLKILEAGSFANASSLFDLDTWRAELARSEHLIPINTGLSLEKTLAYDAQFHSNEGYQPARDLGSEYVHQAEVAKKLAESSVQSISDVYAQAMQQLGKGADFGDTEKAVSGAVENGLAKAEPDLKGYQTKLAEEVNKEVDMTDVMKEKGSQGGQSFTDGLLTSINGTTISPNLTISGTYYMSGSAANLFPNPAAGVFQNIGGVKKGGTVKKHASGGILTAPHIGMVAEDGPEAVIPLRKSVRSYDLYRQTGEILGASGSTTFSPVFHITVNGGDKNTAEKTAKLTQAEFEKFYNRMMKGRLRTGL